MSDDAVLDRAIDEVAREMTVGEPSAAMRAHVTARIADAPPALPRSIGRSAIAAAAIVALALVTYLARRQPDGAREVVAARHGVEAPAATHTAVPRAAPPRPATTAVATTAPRSHGGRRLTTSSRMATPPSDIDSIAPPPLGVVPLGVVPLGVDDIGPPPMDVPFLEPIAPLAVAPLGEGDRR